MLYFPTLKYFSKNSYIDYDMDLSEKSMTWYMDTREKITMEKFTPAIAYDMTTDEYFVMKAPKKGLNIIRGFSERFKLAMPLAIFSGLSLFGCLMSLCLYLAKAVEDAESQALLNPHDRNGELVFLNTSQMTIPANYGMDSTRAKHYKEVLKQYQAQVDMEEIYY